MQPKKTSSIDWLVSGRGYAMILIYISHAAMTYIGHKESVAMPYGHIMGIMLIPFFVVLSGAFYSKVDSSYFQFFKLKFTQRYVPVVFYALLVTPIYYLFSEDMFSTASRYWPSYFIGIPALNWPTWFLVGLFSSELIYYFIQKAKLSKNQSHLLALILFIVGCTINAYRYHLGPLLDALTMAWMIHSVPLFLALLIMGNSYKREILRLRKWSTGKVFIYLIPSIAILIASTLLNNEFPDNNLSEGLRRELRSDLPLMFIGQYGNPVYFLLSITSGVISFFLLARLLPSLLFVRWVADNSMILLGLNGIFHHALNYHIVTLFPLPSEHLFWYLLYASIIGILSIIALIPLVLILQKLLPQLVGKPMINGPILPAIYRKKSAGN